MSGLRHASISARDKDSGLRAFLGFFFGGGCYTFRLPATTGYYTMQALILSKRCADKPRKDSRTPIVCACGSIQYRYQAFCELVLHRKASAWGVEKISTRYCHFAKLHPSLFCGVEKSCDALSCWCMCACACVVGSSKRFCCVESGHAKEKRKTAGRCQCALLRGKGKASADSVEASCQPSFGRRRRSCLVLSRLSGFLRDKPVRVAMPMLGPFEKDDGASALARSERNHAMADWSAHRD